MSTWINQPQIEARTIPEQVAQTRRYLYRLTQELNYALSSLEKQEKATAETVNKTEEKINAPVSEEDAKKNFASIKQLIIKSADIVNAYYETITERLEGVYVAESDFGIYKEQTAQEIEKTSTAIETIFTNIQEIISDIEELDTHLIDVSAYLRSGLLYYDDEGIPVYGLEIGQRNTIDGTETFNKYARFVASRLSFYDQNDTEVAYISDYVLHITNAEFSGSVTLGKYKIETINGLAFKYIGG